MLGHNSMARLNTCHQDLITLFLEVDRRLQRIGLDHTILCGHRTKEEQDKAYPQFSKVQWPNSRHNSYPSEAVDAGPYFPEIRNVDWTDAAAFARYAGYVVAVADELYFAGKIGHRVKWGGDWDMDGRTKDHSFVDSPHFELIK